MGLVYADIEVENLFQKRTLPLRALVDSGAVFLSIPEHATIQLGFDTSEVTTREVVLANGHRQKVPMVGPLRVRFENRFCDLSALVLGDEPLLGAVPMEMMNLILHPATKTLSVNPQSPYIPVALAK